MAKSIPRNKAICFGLAIALSFASLNIVSINAQTPKTRKLRSKAQSSGAPAIISRFISALQNRDFKTVIDLTYSYQQEVALIKAQKPRALWPKLIGEYYERKISNLTEPPSQWGDYGRSSMALMGDPAENLRAIIYFLPRSCKWRVSEVRNEDSLSVVYGIQARSNVYISVNYPSREDAPIVNGSVLKQTMLKFPVQRNTHLVVNVFKVGEADEYWSNVERPNPLAQSTVQDVTVSNFSEFVAAVASNTTIKLKPGEYIINESILGNANNPYITWTENRFESDPITVRFGLTIKNVSNLKIVGIKGREKPHFIQPNESATVLIFNNTFNIVLDNVLVGHSPTTRECFAGVAAFYNSDNVKISKSVLYGSGTTGIELFNVHNLDFFDSVITKCTALIMQIGYHSDGVIFRSSKFIDNEAQEIRVFENSNNISFTDLEVTNNGNAEYDHTLFDVWDGCKNVSLTKSKIKNNKIAWFEGTEGNLIYDASNEIDFSQFINGKSRIRK